MIVELSVIARAVSTERIAIYFLALQKDFILLLYQLRMYVYYQKPMYSVITETASSLNYLIYTCQLH